MTSESMARVLTIAGSDSSGGAGIQADIKTMAAHGVYAMSVITALTAQNTVGVQGIHEVPAEFVGMQLDSVFTDIRPDAVKIGMVSSAELIRTIAHKLDEYGAINIVVDPVMVATSGGKLMRDGTAEVLLAELCTRAIVVTPNLAEASALLNREISTQEEMEHAARELSEQCNSSVLIKGGHLTESASDVLFERDVKRITWYTAQRLKNQNVHGTGCTLSSAIASNLGRGYDLKTSVKCAKEYVSGAIADGLNLGSGSGPLNHLYCLSGVPCD